LKKHVFGRVRKGAKSDSFSSSSSSSSFSSICGAGGNPAYRISAFKAVFTLTPVFSFPFISRGATRQTA
jgi:hypothetical protein